MPHPRPQLHRKAGLLLLGLGISAATAPEARAGGAWSDPDLPWCDVVEAPAAPDASVDEACEGEVAVGSFSPSVKWQWDTNTTHSGYVDLMMTPAVGNLDDDDGDGDIDEDDVPDVVVNAYTGEAYSTYGALVAMSGDDGTQTWSVRSVSYKGSTYYIGASGGVALGDLEGDGSPDVCTVGYTGTTLICLEGDGTVKWVATASASRYDAPAIADLDNDGEAEVILGGYVYDTDGTRLWTGSGSFCYAINLDDDTGLEVVCGGYAYDTDGTKLFGSLAGFSAAGDFDDDGEPELAVVVSNYLYLLDTDGTTLWSTRIYSPGGYTSGGGPPTVADFDGDNKVEIGIAGADAYTVYDTDGSRLWYHTIVDTSSRVTGSSVFDFDADGAADVLYADHYTLYVFDGPTGTVKYSNDGHASGTLYEYPVVADVDNDGSSDILIASTNMWWSGWQGVTVLSDASWQPSRPVWNQHTYSITNVNDDLSIPAVVDDNWLSYNNFRTAAPNWGDTNWQVDLAADEAELCYEDCTSPAVNVWVPVHNDGLADAESYTVTFTRDDGSTVYSSVETLTSSGEGEVLGPFTITESMWGDGDLSVTLTPDDGRTDCDETDNTVDLGAWPYPSLDADADGHDAAECGGDDCDDADDTTYEGADELGDDLDNDCDGLADDGLDRDGDGLVTEDELELGTDPMDDDTDDDGLIDGSEVGSTDPLSGDSDGDGLGDGTESGLTEPQGDDTDEGLFVPDADPSTTTDPLDADTDDDGLTDGSEDADADGQTDRGETDATLEDSDGDGVQDGTESGLTEPETADTGGGFIPDSDPSTTTDPTDDDTDDDGLLDGTEDGDADGATDEGETDALDDDTDGDGVGDGTESGLAWAEGMDTDGGFTPDADPSTTTDPLDDDSDDDGLMDGSEDGDGDGATGSHETDPNAADTDGDGLGDGTESGLDYAEGEDTDGGFTPDADPSTTTDPLDDDSDDDGLMDGSEDSDGDGATGSRETDATEADTDGDGVGDGVESGLSEPQGEDTDGAFAGDADPDTTTDPLDDDSDDDGLMDGSEDTDADGAADDGETDPLTVDTDGDGVADGVESGLTEPQGEDTDGAFTPDADPGTTTDPTDDDSDDDGLMDGSEDGDADGATSGAETDPGSADTDGDGVQDGTESGATTPQGDDTDGAVFVPDDDPSTTTDPLDADTDDGTVSDGAEDADADGRVDEGECDPLDPSDDADCAGIADTGDTADTGAPDTGELDTASGLEEAKGWYQGGCACSSAPSPSGGLLAAGLGLLALGRRRRARV